MRRGPRKARYDRAAIDAVLSRGLLAHVSFADSGQPYCIPMLYAHVGDGLYVHGSRRSRAVRLLATGRPACATVTLLDGLVLARSVFEHSANYASLIALGSFQAVTDADERLAALEAFTERLVPGRWAEVRAPSANELRATAILQLPLDEVSVKSRSGPPDDGNSSDAGRSTWAGVLPIETRFGTPIPAPELADNIPLAPSVQRLTRR